MFRARAALVPVSAVVVAFAAVFGLSGCDAGGPTSGVTATPISSESADLEVAAIPSSVAPADFADAFISDALSRWIMAGATAEHQKVYLTTGGDSAYVLGLSEANGDRFADVLLVQGWRDQPELVNFVDRMKHLNAGSLKYWFEASGSRASEGEPAWNRTLTVDGASVVSDATETGFRVHVVALDHANAAENGVGRLDPASLTIDGQRTAYELLIVDDGDDLRVASVSVSG